MVAVTESELLDALVVKHMSSLSTINTTVFTAVNSPAFEASATSFPNSRSEKFIDLNGSNQKYTYSMRPYDSKLLTKGIAHAWIKPDFIQTEANNKFLFDNLHNPSGSNYNGQRFYMNRDQDDWTGVYYTYNGGGYPLTCTTAGQTWSANAVIHVAMLWDTTRNLDGNYAIALFINNTLAASGTQNYPITTDTLSTACVLGGDYVGTASAYWDGGVMDFSFLEYSTLAASHTDAEIVQALYSNTFNDGAHKFVCELSASAVTFTPRVMMF